MSVKSFMDELNLQYHVKAISIGLSYMAIAVGVVSALTIIITTIINLFGLQSIFIMIMVFVICLFAWLFGDMHISNKKWDKERKNKQ